MRKSIYAGVAAVLLAATAPAFAGSPITDLSSQGVVVEGPGVGVRIGEDRRWDRDRPWRAERFERDRHFRAGCQTIVSKERTPDGVVIRKRSTCD